MQTAQLNRRSHFVFLLNYHLVLVVKYRRNVINDSISDNLKTIFNNVAVKYTIQVKEWNHDKDHIHVLLEQHHQPILFLSLTHTKVVAVELLN
jgi:putative transposase